MRTQRLVVILSVEERASIEQAAAFQSLSLSAYMRSVLVKKAKADAEDPLGFGR